jgi:transcriptional regulator with XRE-family HTH domain
MEAIEMQQQFFSLLKNSLPTHVSMADELAEKMGLSYDSIYRRIRGEKSLSMAELKMLCQHYNISLDQVLELQNSTVVFSAPDINFENLPFLDYMKGLLAQLKQFNSYSKKRMRYVCKDMTFFYFFLFPDLSAFKSFFFIKTIQNDSSLSKSSFSLQRDGFAEYFALGQQILREYNQIPSVELWNIESVNSTISQIEYYRDAGLFENRKDMLTVIDSLQEVMDHLQMQVEKGIKFMPGDPETMYQESIQFYVNEVVLGSNTILIESDNIKEAWVTYNVLSYMATSDPRFSKKAFASFDNLLSRSTLISATGEKERKKFFYRVKEKLNQLKMTY